MGNVRNKQFISYKLGSILTTVVEPHSVRLHPAPEANHPFAQSIHSVYTTSPVAVLVIR